MFVLKGKYPLVLAAFLHSFEESSNSPLEADKAHVKWFNEAFERQENLEGLWWGGGARGEGRAHRRGGERMNTC